MFPRGFTSGWNFYFYCLQPAGLKLKLLFLCLSRLQGWVPPPACAGHSAGASVDWGVGETAFVWATVRPPASIPCLHPIAGYTCGQLYLLHCTLPLPEPLTHPQLPPHRITAQHPWAPTASLPKQKREWGVAVWWGLLIVRIWPRRCGTRTREVAREEWARESEERGEPW